MTEKNYLTAADVSEYMGVSIPMAYKIIRKLNDELKEQGYITVSGKLPRRYFEQRTYSNEDNSYKKAFEHYNAYGYSIQKN